MSVDKSAARVRRMFGQIAPRYDLLNHLLSLSIDRWWRRRTVRLVPPDGHHPILDVCTGTGDLALAYWRAGNPKKQPLLSDSGATAGSSSSVGKNSHENTAGQASSGTREKAGRGTLEQRDAQSRDTRIVGADFCRPMLAIARKKCLRQNAADRIALVEADAARLPFADRTFQIVSVAFGLRNLCDTDAGLAEMVRVCRSGGRVAVLEFSMPKGRLLGAVYRWYFRHILPRVGEALARNAEGAYNYLPASVGQFLDAETLVARMQAAGLDDVRAYPFTRGIATLVVGRRN